MAIGCMKHDGKSALQLTDTLTQLSPSQNTGESQRRSKHWYLGLAARPLRNGALDEEQVEEENAGHLDQQTEGQHN